MRERENETTMVIPRFGSISRRTWGKRWSEKYYSSRDAMLQNTWKDRGGNSSHSGSYQMFHYFLQQPLPAVECDIAAILDHTWPGHITTAIWRQCFFRNKIEHQQKTAENSKVLTQINWMKPITCSIVKARQRLPKVKRCQLLFAIKIPYVTCTTVNACQSQTRMWRYQIRFVSYIFYVTRSMFTAPPQHSAIEANHKSSKNRMSKHRKKLLSVRKRSHHGPSQANVPTRRISQICRSRNTWIEAEKLH